jgi:hypothetical protein
MTTSNRIDELEQQVLTLQRRLMEAEAKSIRAEEQLERVTVEVGIRDAIAKSTVPVNPAAVPDIIKRASAGNWRQDPQHGLLQMDGGLPATDASGHYVTPACWLSGLAQEASHLFAPAGSNAETTTKNPFLKSDWNMTEQGKLVRENPTLAKSLAKAAGIKLEV